MKRKTDPREFAKYQVGGRVEIKSFNPAAKTSSDYTREIASRMQRPWIVWKEVDGEPRKEMGVVYASTPVAAIINAAGKYTLERKDIVVEPLVHGW